MFDPNFSRLTPYDAESAMNYCRTNWDAPPTFWDLYGLQQIYGRRTEAIVPIITAFSPSRGDHLPWFNASANPDYFIAYAEGWIYTQNAPGTVPLDLYWHSGRGDYMAVATDASRQAALASGYQLTVTMGYVYPTQQPGTVPFKLYWSSAREDNFTTASSVGAQNAIGAGYTYVRDEAYVFADIPYDMLTNYYSDGRKDWLLTRTGSSRAADAVGSGYLNRGFDGMTLKYNVPGTSAFRQFWSASREEHYLTGTAAGAQNAINAGYTELSGEGYVFTTQAAATSPFQLYWDATNLDNVTSYVSDFTGDGFARIWNEGYMYAYTTN